VQSGANQASAVVGGQVDAAVVPETYVKSALQAGDAKLLGYVGDETPWQLGAAFTATRTANERRDTVERFLTAYKKGVREFHDAFTGPDERRRDGPTADAVVAIIAKYVGESPEKVRLATAYYDRDARLDVKDVLHQIAWYKAQGLIKGEVDGERLIDKRYVVPLP
jgi:NitT/TauT family transport system substrate-binding protein